MKLAPIIMSLVGAMAVSGAVTGCGGAVSARETAPVVTSYPDDFVLRDVRKDAAHHLRCQVPMIDVSAGPWAGSSGNIVAFGCGFQITYYVACKTNHLCDFSVAE